MACYHLVSLPKSAGDARLEALNELVRADTEFDDFFRALALVPTRLG
jgi:hypothetical protein